MAVRIPETNKRPGVCYAVTVDGIELPVIDVTHPAFAVDLSDEQLSALIDESLRTMEALRKVPPENRRAIAQASLLGRGWMESAGTFLSGMMTYLNRLGPDNLGDGYAGPVDRKIAAGLAPTSFRFRLRDIARLLAEELRGALAAAPDRPLRVLNIGGGPAAESFNALLLLHKENPEWLRRRRTSIQVLDLDSEGPAFGADAVSTLIGRDGPLEGLDVTFRYTHYNWAEASVLDPVLRGIEPDAIVAVSSEGALFDYGSDDDIVANLESICAGTPHDCIVAGSVVRHPSSLDPRLAGLQPAAVQPSIRYMGIEAFRVLASRGGWVVSRVLDSLAHHAAVMKKTRSPLRH